MTQVKEEPTDLRPQVRRRGPVTRWPRPCTDLNGVSTHRQKAAGRNGRNGRYEPKAAVKSICSDLQSGSITAAPVKLRACAVQCRGRVAAGRPRQRATAPPRARFAAHMAAEPAVPITVEPSDLAQALENLADAARGGLQQGR